jgi:hypothetical protein
MSQGPLPPALARRGDRDAIHEDVAPYRGTTLAQRSEILSALCRLAAEQVAASGVPERILAHEDHRSAESERLWLRLVAAAR